MKITAETVRAASGPVCSAAAYPLTAQYCVGGALCCYIAALDESEVDENARFPSPEHLDEALSNGRRINGLNPYPVDLYGLAVAIPAANDAGDFDEAWRLLDLALTGDNDAITAVVNARIEARDLLFRLA